MPEDPLRPVHVTEPVFDLDTELGPTPPSLQPVLLAAAQLWCRSMTWPTVRQIAELAGVAPSTALSPVRTSVELRQMLVRVETRTLERIRRSLLDRGAGASGVDVALRERARQLARIDPVLVRLPLIATLAVDDPTWSRAVPPLAS